MDDFVLDTGCNQTMVHSSLVGKDALIPGLSVDICCAHGDVESYPVVYTTVVVQDQELDIQACVSNTLPHAALLGMDVTVLPTLLPDPEDARDSDVTDGDTENALAVTRVSTGGRSPAV